MLKSAAVIASTLSVAVAHAGPTLIIADDDPAPDGNGTVSFIDDAFDLNNLGQIVCFTTCDNTSAGREDEYALVLASADSGMVVARGGFTAPAGQYRFFSDPKINDNGDIVAFASFNDPDTGDTRLETVTLFPAAGPAVRLAEENVAFPTADGTFDGLYRDFPPAGAATWDINAHADVMFNASLTVGTDIYEGLFFHDGVDDKIVARAPADDFGNGPMSRVYSLALNSSGQFAVDYLNTGFDAVRTVSLCTFDEAGVGYSSEFIAAEGMVFQPTGEPLGVLSTVSLNDAGQVAFRAVIEPSGDRAVLRYDGGALTIAVRDGDPGPGGLFEIPSNPAINNSGQIAFFARTNDNGARTDGVFLLEADGMISAVARVGDALGGSTIAVIQINGLAVNDAGQVAFAGRLADGRDFIALSDPMGPSPCSAADLAEPFGVLDLADITAFVSAFTTQDPAADFDANGIFDLADITAFVGAFTAGCP